MSHSPGLDQHSAAQPPSRAVLVLCDGYPSLHDSETGARLEARLRRLRQLLDVRIRVVAPLPGLVDRSATAPPELEKRDDVIVHRPGYLGAVNSRNPSAATFYQRSVHPFLKDLIARRGPFDLIDAHGLGRETAAALAVAAPYGVPVLATETASPDVLHAHLRADPVRLRAHLSAAAAVVGQTWASYTALAALAAGSPLVAFAPNGVDAALFSGGPERIRAKEALELPKTQALLVAYADADLSGLATVAAAMPETPDAVIAAQASRETIETARRALRRAGLGDKVLLRVGGSEAARAALFSAADIIVSVCAETPAPLRAVEAALSGAWVIAPSSIASRAMLGGADGLWLTGPCGDDPSAPTLPQALAQALARRPSAEARSLEARTALGAASDWTAKDAALCALYAQALGLGAAQRDQDAPPLAAE